MPFVRPLAAACVAAAAIAGAGGTAGAAPAPPVDVVVEFAPGTSDAARGASLAAAGMTVLEPIGDDFALVSAPAGATPVGALVDVDPVVPVAAAMVPTDPEYGRQWHLRAVQGEAAWDVADGTGVVVAVVDSGVRRSAPDLSDVTFVAGKDFVDDDLDPDDANGHGTHVTGTVAQDTGDGYGAAGLAFGATVMPLRVLDADGRGTDADVAAAIHHAVANGADVINLSLGGPSPSTVLSNAVSTAVSAGVVVVAAAGNSGTAGVQYPAAFPGVIGVGAVNQTLARASFSTWGPHVDLAAPGTGVVQETFSGASFCHCAMSGTSMATPHVAAAAALLLDHGASPSAVPGLLATTAMDLGPSGRDEETGAGMIQIAGALAAAGAPAAAPAQSPAPAPAPAPADEVEVTEPAPLQPGVQDIADACPAGAVQPGRFVDVDPVSVHALAIDCAAGLGLAGGVTADTFAPAAALTRAQMATFLARLLDRAGAFLPTAAPDAFADDAGSPHEAAINRLAAVGIVRGTGPGQFSPAAPVSRAAMASFLVAAYDHAAAADLAEAAGNPFGDDDGNTHEASIGRLAGAGIATGTGPGTFAPAALVTRAQVATFLARTFDALIDAGDAPAP